MASLKGTYLKNILFHEQILILKPCLLWELFFTGNDYASLFWWCRYLGIEPKLLLQLLQQQNTHQCKPRRKSTAIKLNDTSKELTIKKTEMSPVVDVAGPSVKQTVQIQTSLPQQQLSKPLLTDQEFHLVGTSKPVSSTKTATSTKETADCHWDKQLKPAFTKTTQKPWKAFEKVQMSVEYQKGSSRTSRSSLSSTNQSQWSRQRGIRWRMSWPSFVTTWQIISSLGLDWLNTKELVKLNTMI